MRAKDVLMAATVDKARREIFLTGAIDQNDVSILVSIRVPAAGLWRVIKAETNLTKESWSGWEIAFGPQSVVPKSTNIAKSKCRNFKKLIIDTASNRILFHGGFVRPGEPILKSFYVRMKSPGVLYMSHRRHIVDPLKAFNDEVGMTLPEVRFTIPTRLA